MTDLPIDNQQLLTKAFTHRSFLNETEDGSVIESNERLEFLGDAVLELIVSEHLFTTFPDKPEGELTALRAALVKTTTLAQLSEKLGLGERLLMSKGEINTGGRSNQSLLANTFEAVLGAIYLDKGTQVVKEFLETHLFTYLPDIIENNLHRDFKSTFQERVQAAGFPTPIYKLISEEGPDHLKEFTMVLIVGNTEVATGSGKNKQSAQQAAAQEGLLKLDQGFKL